MRTEYLWTKEQRIAMWGDGPWVDEPDVVEWTPPEHDLPCLILRIQLIGNLNGYAGVPPGHPLHGRSEHRVHFLATGLAKEVTFAGPRFWAGTGVMNYGDKGNISDPYKDYWFFGFHTANGTDLVPHAYKLSPELFRDSRYWDFRAVRAQCELLAACLHRGRVLKPGDPAMKFNPTSMEALRIPREAAVRKTWAEWKRAHEKKEGSDD